MDNNKNKYNKKYKHKIMANQKLNKDFIERWKKAHEKQMASQYKSQSENKRSDRKKKIERVFNYEPEMKFLESFYNLKFKNDITLDAFISLTQISLVDTDLVSDVVFDFFIEGLKIKEKIKEKKVLFKKAQNEMASIDEEITNLESQLRYDIEEYDDELFGLE